MTEEPRERAIALTPAGGAADPFADVEL